MRSRRLSLIFMAFYFTFIGGSSYYVQVFPVRVIHHVLVTLLLAFWLVGRIRSRKGIPATGLNTPIYALIVIWFITSLTGLDARMSLERTWFLLLHVGMFFVAVDMIQRGYQKIVMEALFFMAAGVIFLTGLELASWYFGLGIIPGTEIGWIATGRLPALTDFPQVKLAMTISTLLAGYVAPLVTVCAAWAMTVRGRDYRIALWGMTACLAIILLLTSSRGGALSLMAAVGMLILFRLLQHPRLKSTVSPVVLTGIGVLLVAGASVAFAVLTFPNSNQGSNQGRLAMWQGAVTLFGEHPVSGVGIGLFGRGFRDVRDIAIAEDKLASAHNIYLNTLAETGIVGAIIGLWLVGAFLWRTWQNWQVAPSPQRRFRIETMFAALVGLAVHSMVDVFSITPIVLLFVTLAAYAITSQPVSRLDPVKQGQRLPAIIGLILVLLYGLAFVQFDRAQALYMQSLDTDAPQDSLAKVREAQAIDPHLNLYKLHEAYLIGATGDIPAAMTAYQNALALEPTWDVGWMNLAVLAEQNGQIDDAMTYLDRAAQILPANGAVVHLARLAEATGSQPEATIIEEYFNGIAWHYRIQLVLPLANFWHETPLRIKALDRLAASNIFPPEFIYRIWQVHDPAKAAALVPDNPVTPDDWWITGENALTVLHDPQTAVTDFTNAINAAPGNGDYYVSRARALFAIDKDAALADLNTAQAHPIYFESPNALRAQLVDDPEKAFDLTLMALPPHSATQEFAAVMYDRPAVFDIYPPMRFPGYGDAQLQPWLHLAEQYLAEGNTGAAGRMYRFIYENEPYNAAARDGLQRLGIQP